MRAVAKADGSVGRLFEGHLNALSSGSRSTGIDPEEHLARRVGRRSAPERGRAGAHVESDGAPRREGVLLRRRRARPGARDCAASGQPRSSTSTSHATSRSTASWYRAGGMRASESHRVVFHGAPVLAAARARRARPRAVVLRATRSAPRRPGRGSLDAAADAALARPRGQARADDLRALAAGRIVTARGDDRPLVRARGARRRRPRRPSRSQLRAGGRRRGRGRSSTRPRARRGSRPFATGTALDRARRDFELFVLQHRLDPLVARLGRTRVDAKR